MRTTSAPHTIATVAAAAALGAALVGCAPAASDDGGGTGREVTQLQEEAEQYVGDPWEQRYRAQFWKSQHIHDSWNPCHIGENVPKRLQGSGPDCWSRLPGHTVR
jgi:hypothetical protein